MVDASLEAQRPLHVQPREAFAPFAKGDSLSLAWDMRTVHRAFRYRLYPTAEQEAALWQYAGVCRLVYNLGLEQRRDFWRQYRRAEGRPISYFSQSRELTQLRAEFDWIRAVPATACAYALQDVDRAFTSYFAGRTAYPRPRRRDQGHGFRLKGKDTRVESVSEKWGAVYVAKLGLVRFRLTRPIRGVVRNLTINCTAGAWHVSFAADWEEEDCEAPRGALGLDLGVARSVTLSTGEHFQAPAPNGLAVARAQRDLARKTRGSKRHQKQVQRVAKLRAKAARQRADWAHKVTTSIARQTAFVIAEDLDVRAMTRSAAGTVEEPGKGVAAKRGLNRSILAQGWGIVRQQLAYKLEARGGQLVLVDPRHTSQTCSACGTIDASSRESQAVFRCVHCGHEDNADVNAAKEILRRGAARLDVEAGDARPVKRQSERTADHE